MIRTTIITDELKNMVSNSVNNNPIIEPLDLTVHKRFCVGNVSMSVLPDGSIISYLPDDFTKDQATLWKADVGGVLVKELKQKDCLLFEHKSENFKVLLKKIRETEVDDFKNRKLLHLTVAESEYCIIKAVKITDTLYINSVRNEKYVTDVQEDENESVHYIDDSTNNTNTNESIEYSLF